MKFDVAKFTNGLLNVGQNLTQQAMTFSVMKDMNRNNSIFGGMGMGFGGFGVNQSFMMGGFGCGGNYGYYNNSGIDPNAYMYGYMTAAQTKAQIDASYAAKEKANAKPAKASAVDANQDTKKAEEFEKATKEGLKDGKSFSFLPESWTKLFEKGSKATEQEQKEMVEGYKKGALEMGKSYLKHIDKNYGNNDGYMSEDEFVKYSLAEDFAPLKEGATAEEKAKYESDKKAAESIARVAYQKINQNKDDTVDYVEMGAMFSAVDSKGDNAAIDGKFDAKDFRTFSENLATAEENSADKFLKLAYKNLSSND